MLSRLMEQENKPIKQVVAESALKRGAPLEDGAYFADVQKNYLCKLPAERQKFYMDQMAYVGLAEEDITRRAKLDGRYFIGYNKKRAELLMKAKEQKAKEQSDKAVAKPGDAPNACA